VLRHDIDKQFKGKRQSIRINLDQGETMSTFTLTKYVCALALLVFLGSTAQGATLWVHCGSTSGLNSIGAALRVLQNFEESHGPNTINVSGACNENVQIRDMDRVTLNAINGASITDASNGVFETIGIYRGNGITINGLIVNGGADAISIGMATVVLRGITAQRAVNDGVGVYPSGIVFIVGGTLQNNSYAGLGVFGGDANAAGVTTQHNANGIIVDRGGRVQYRVSDPPYDGGNASVPAIISQNNDVGILAQHNGEITCLSCEITFNASSGVSLDLGATATFRRYFFTSGQPAAPLSITDNGGPGVSVGDLSSADLPFDPNTVIQRNGGQYEIACNSATAVTRRALQFAAGATNCTN
jgi:hypothetical protein